VIRRGFWLTAGAVTGIMGYRRVCAVGRRVSATLSPRTTMSPRATLSPGATPGTSLSRGGRPGFTRRGAVGVARETFRFARDVREGMELYMARHSASAGPTLSTNRNTVSTNRDAQPEDGH
jgi:hypothetical protein